MVIPDSVLDQVLTLQLAVGWAGEGGDEPRLGWWKTDMVNEFGGIDLFKQLLPGTWQWAVLEATREAARIVDQARRSADQDPDRLLTLFHLGHNVDELLKLRLYDLKQSGRSPLTALPELSPLMGSLESPRHWNVEAFSAWLQKQGGAETAVMPAGRRLKSVMPKGINTQAQLLAAALVPLPREYPTPYFERGA